VAYAALADTIDVVLVRLFFRNRIDLPGFGWLLRDFVFIGLRMSRKSQRLCEHCNDGARQQSSLKTGLSGTGKAGKGSHGSPAEGQNLTTDRRK